MSVKNNALFAALVASLGLTVSASPVCESLVNDLTVNSVSVYEYDATGRVFVVVEVDTGSGSVNRAICDANGDLKIYGNAVTAVAFAKRSGNGLPIEVTTFEKASSVGDPIKSLIAKHKAFKTEDGKAGAAATAIAAKLSAAASLGWDTATGTPEATEYADLTARQVSIAEWKTFTAGKVTTLTAALVTAGIDPVTYATV